MQFHSFSPSVAVAKVAVVVARAKVAAVAREGVGAKVVLLVQERAIVDLCRALSTAHIYIFFSCY